MLRFISVFIENIISTLWGFISVVHQVGGALALLLKWLGFALVELSAAASNFCIVLYEDLKNFVDDINVNYVQALKVFHHRLTNVFNDVISFIEFVTEYSMGSFYATKAAVNWFCVQWFDLTTSAATAVRTACILIGSSTWMLIMFIPNLIILFVTYILHALTYLWQSIVMLALSVISSALGATAATADYFRAFPMKSLFGLAIFGLLVKYRYTLFAAVCTVGQGLTMITMYVVYQFINYAQVVLSGLRRAGSSVADALRLRSQMRYSSASSDENHENQDECERINGEINDRCVICRDRRKTVLLMPCRHLCLCRICATHLGNYRTVCPLCRKTYFNTIQIYT